MIVARFGKASIIGAVAGIAMIIAGSIFDPSYTLMGWGMLVFSSSVSMGLTGYCHYRASEESDPWVSGLYIASAFVVTIAIIYTLMLLTGIGYSYSY